MGIKSMPSRHTAWGLTPRPNGGGGTAHTREFKENIPTNTLALQTPWTPGWESNPCPQGTQEQDLMFLKWQDFEGHAQ